MVLELYKPFVTDSFVEGGQDRVIVQQRFVGVDAIIIAGNIEQLCAGDGGILAKANLYAKIMHYLSGLFDFVHALAW